MSFVSFSMFLILLSLLTLPLWTSGLRPPIRPITGAYIKEVDNIIIYDNAVPVFYNILVPVIPPMDSLKMLEGTCSSKNETICSARATAINHLKQSYQTLQTIMDSLIDTAPMTTLNKESSEENSHVRGRRSVFGFVGDALGYCCDLTTKADIADLESNNEAVQDYMNTLKESIVQEHQYLLQVYNSTSNVNSETSKELLRLHKWAADFTKKMQQQENNEARVDSSIQDEQLTDLLILLTTSQMQYWLAETSRMSTILHSCQNQQLSPAAVPPAILQANLLKLQETFASHERTLSIPSNQVQKYFRLKLTSCSVTETKVTLRVQVPVTKDPSRKLLVIKRVPFLWENATCHLRLESTYMAVGKSTSIIAGTDIHHCTPASGLCRVPAYHSDLLHGSSCPYKLLSKATIQELSRECLLQCSPYQSPVVTQVGLHTYVISGMPNGTQIQCQNESFPLIPPATGSLEVDLTCNCSIFMPGHGSLDAPFPCPKSLKSFTTVIHVIPVAWVIPNSQQISVATQHESSTYENLSDILNTNWTMELPTVQLTIPEHVLAAHRKIPKLIHHSALVLPTFSFLWNLVLSLAVIWLLYQHTNSLPWIVTLSSLFRPSNAETDLHTAVDQLGHILLIAVLINGVIILIVIVSALYLLCRSINARKEIKNAIGSMPDAEMFLKAGGHASNSYIKASDPADDLPETKRKQRSRKQRRHQPTSDSLP